RLIHTVSFPVTLTARNYLKNKVFWVVATETQFLEPQPSRRYVYAQFVPPNLKADEREVPPVSSSALPHESCRRVRHERAERVGQGSAGLGGLSEMADSREP